MDYAIFKTIDGRHPHVIHRFTQEACNHRAKLTAKNKLREMWLRVIQHDSLHRSLTGTTEEFHYDHITSVNTTERIRFYIAPLDTDKQ